MPVRGWHWEQRPAASSNSWHLLLQPRLHAPERPRASGASEELSPSSQFWPEPPRGYWPPECLMHSLVIRQMHVELIELQVVCLRSPHEEQKHTIGALLIVACSSSCKYIKLCGYTPEQWPRQNLVQGVEGGGEPGSPYSWYATAFSIRACKPYLTTVSSQKTRNLYKYPHADRVDRLPT